MTNKVKVIAGQNWTVADAIKMAGALNSSQSMTAHQKKSE